jgi:LmbE family N-acetylglucosaminyl deacetylase
MRLFKKLTPEERRRNAKRRVVAYGSLALILVSFYYYQPQRINFVEKKVPNPNPPVDPNSAGLFSKGVKIALIQAHPDDSEFFLAPLLLRLAKSGADIHQLVMTDGDKSFYFWKHEDAAENRRVREKEQLDAASHYAKEVIFLHRPDGRLQYQQDNAKQVQAFLQRIQPEYVVCFDSEYWPRINHADHLASGRATWEAVTNLGNVPSVKWLLLFDTRAPNFTPEVSDTVDEGVNMLAIHKSQFFGARLEMLKNNRLEAYHDAGEAAGGSYGVALRAVRVGK